MKKLLFFAFAFSVGYKGIAQTYEPVALTGYTADIVANGQGAVSAVTTNDADGASFAFVAQNYINPSNVSPTSALPTNGLINSAATAGLTYQLASYSANNSLRISGAGTGTLTFNTPQAADQVYVLATSGSGTSTVTITVTFTDATTQVFTGQTISDWYNGAGFAIQGISRVSRATNSIENSTTNPRLYQTLLTLNAANVGKTIQSINFNKTSTGGVLNVMGISLRTIPSTLTNDAGITSISAPTSGCTLTSQETITVTLKNIGTTAQSNIPVSYTINGGTAVNEIFAGPLAGNTSATYSFTTKANLSTAGTYNLTVRTNLSGDLLATNDAISKTIILSTPAATPTITASGSTTICSGSTVTLTAASATSGATYTWFINGNMIPGIISANYTATNAGSYTVMATAGGCNSTASAATIVTINYPPSTPTVSAGGPTSFCSGGSVTLDAFTPNVGATYIWFNNGNVIPGATSATYVATASGNYSAAANLNGCGGTTSNPLAVSVSAQPATPTISQSGFVLTSSNIGGNQWFKNGTAITGATSQTYTTTSNGTYTVVVTNNGCSSNASNAVNITTTGLKETQNLNLNIYPNPSNGVFNLSLPQGQEYRLTVTDLTGKVLLQQTAIESNTQLNLNNAAKGIYFLKLVSNGKTAIQKLIVE